MQLPKGLPTSRARGLRGEGRYLSVRGIYTSSTFEGLQTPCTHRPTRSTETRAVKAPLDRMSGGVTLRKRPWSFPQAWLVLLGDPSLFFFRRMDCDSLECAHGLGFKLQLKFKRPVLLLCDGRHPVTWADGSVPLGVLAG